MQETTYFLSENDPTPEWNAAVLTISQIIKFVISSAAEAELGALHIMAKEMVPTHQTFLMVHARVPEVYVHFALMYTIDHIFPVLPIKDLINEDDNPTTPHKLSTGMKPSVSHLRVLFFPFVVRKAKAHVQTKTLNMHHQAQKGFHGIFVGIPEHQKGYLVYVPSTRKVISSYDVVFDEGFSSALAYTSRPY